MQFPRVLCAAAAGQRPEAEPRRWPNWELPRAYRRRADPRLAAFFVLSRRQNGEREMKTVLAAIASLALLSSASPAHERACSAALGALSGAVVLGPVGAVAGAVVGYTAGPSIARSWGLRRSSTKSRRQSSKRGYRGRTTVSDSGRAPGAQTESRNATSTAAMAAEPRAVPPKVTLPPVQALDY